MSIGPGLRWAIEACRAGEGGPADIFSQGGRCSVDDLVEFVPDDVVADLDANEFIDRSNGVAQLTVRCTNINNLVSVMPSQQKLGADYVHINIDTMWLLKLIWQHGKPGAAAIELGTGNGIIAAHMVARYRHVVATDVPGPWLRFAQLTLQANAGRGRPSDVLACDVATALRPGHFDLVAVNAPWSPAAPLDAHGNEMTFMDGGPTGTELPARFLHGGAALLRPGGVAIVLCLDPEFEDGSRPLMPALDKLRSAGFEVECLDSEVFESELVTERLRARRLPTLAFARHIAVIVRAAG